QPKIHDQMAFTLVFSMAVVALLFTWLLVHRWRLAWLEEQVQGHDLDQAIIERRAEAGFSPSPAPSPAPPAPAPPATAGVERA
ncbi:MAG: hypothetical protein ACXWB2_17825, partial [Acidimicrobiales bacterium]